MPNLIAYNTHRTYTLHIRSVFIYQYFILLYYVIKTRLTHSSILRITQLLPSLVRLLGYKLCMIIRIYHQAWPLLLWDS